MAPTEDVQQGECPLIDTTFLMEFPNLGSSSRGWKLTEKQPLLVDPALAELTNRGICGITRSFLFTQDFFPQLCQRVDVTFFLMSSLSFLLIDPMIAPGVTKF